MPLGSWSWVFEEGGHFIELNKIIIERIVRELYIVLRQIIEKLDVF